MENKWFNNFENRNKTNKSNERANQFKANQTKGIQIKGNDTHRIDSNRTEMKPNQFDSKSIFKGFALSLSFSRLLQKRSKTTSSITSIYTHYAKKPEENGKLKTKEKPTPIQSQDKRKRKYANGNNWELMLKNQPKTHIHLQENAVKINIIQSTLSSLWWMCTYLHYDICMYVYVFMKAFVIEIMFIGRSPWRLNLNACSCIRPERIISINSSTLLHVNKLRFFRIVFKYKNNNKFDGHIRVEFDGDVLVELSHILCTNVLRLYRKTNCFPLILSILIGFCFVFIWAKLYWISWSK